MSMIRCIVLGSLGVVLACEGPKGQAGDPGADGLPGADGAAGADGSTGLEGAPGADSDCAGVPPLEISGFSNVPTELLYVNFPSDEITIEINNPDVSYSLAGFGLDFNWTSNTTFTVTPSSDMVSSYSITATDGCSIATATFELEAGAEFGVSSLSFIHLYSGVGGVDIRPAGTSASENIVQLDFTDYTWRSNYDSGLWQFDIVVSDELGNETVVMTTPGLVLSPGVDYTAIAYDNNGGLDVLLQEVSQSALSNVDSTRLRATHLGAGIGQVDILDSTDSSSQVELISDLDFMTTSDYLELAWADVSTEVIGIDVDDDSSADISYSIFSRYGVTLGNVLSNTSVIDVFAFVDAAGLPSLYFYYPYDDYAAALEPDFNATVTEAGVGGQINISPYFEYTESVSISGCDTVLEAELFLDIDNYFWEDTLIATLIAPDGAEFEVFDGVDYTQTINGTFNSTLTGTMNAFVESESELPEIMGASGNGNWTLSLYHDRNGTDVTSLNSWSLSLSCYNN